MLDIKVGFKVLHRNAQLLNDPETNVRYNTETWNYAHWGIPAVFTELQRARDWARITYGDSRYGPMILRSVLYVPITPSAEHLRPLADGTEFAAAILLGYAQGGNLDLKQLDSVFTKYTSGSKLFSFGDANGTVVTLMPDSR